MVSYPFDPTIGRPQIVKRHERAISNSSHHKLIRQPAMTLQTDGSTSICLDAAYDLYCGYEWLTR